jgi:hypothetical protein
MVNSSAGRRTLELVLHGSKPAPMRMTRLEHVLSLPIGYYPVGFLVVGLAVLFLRLISFGKRLWKQREHERL